MLDGGGQGTVLVVPRLQYSHLWHASARSSDGGRRARTSGRRARAAGRGEASVGGRDRCWSVHRGVDSLTLACDASL